MVIGIRIFFYFQKSAKNLGLMDVGLKCIYFCGCRSRDGVQLVRERMNWCLRGCGEAPIC